MRTRKPVSAAAAPAQVVVGPSYGLPSVLLKGYSSMYQHTSVFCVSAATGAMHEQAYKTAGGDAADTTDRSAEHSGAPSGPRYQRPTRTGNV